MLHRNSLRGELLPPHFVMEIAWRNGMMDAAMPFMINSVKQFTDKINSLNKKEEKKEEEKKSKSHERLRPHGDAGRGLGLRRWRLGTRRTRRAGGGGLGDGGMGGGMGGGGMEGGMGGGWASRV